MNYIKILSISALWVIIVLIAVTNKKIREYILSFLNLKILKTNLKVKDVMTFFLVIIIVVTSFSLLKDTKMLYYSSDKSNDSKDEEIYEKNVQKAYDQMAKYNKLMQETKTDIENCKKPYIPDSFRYVEGSWNSGYVIEDENGNQFVWVPCTNIEKNKENIPILSKNIFSYYSITYFSCYNSEDFEDFIKSCLENGGFYISRFEIGKENENPVVKSGCEIWNNITYKDAEEIAKKMYSNINSRLINGYGYDTAVEFILDEVDTKEILQSTGKTGNKAYKNIYDLVDNCGEWTEEMRDGYQIYRKTIFLVNKDILLSDRITGNEEYKNEEVGFRTMLYK